MSVFHWRLRVLEVVVFGPLFFGAAFASVRAQGNLQRIDTTETGSRLGSAHDHANAAIRRKLASLIIPSIEFRSTTPDDAIEFLRQESRRLDPDPDVQARGVNIILRLPAVAQTVAGPQTMVQASRTNVTVSPADPLFGPPVVSTKPRITLSMNRLPLLEALKYVAIQAGLKVRVDPYAVSLVPLEENTDALVTAVFRVSPTFIDNKNHGGGQTALDQAATSAH